MKKSISIRNLYDIQIASKSQIEELDNEDDAIKASLCMMLTHLAQMIPLLASEGFAPTAKTRPVNSLLVKNSAIVLQNLILLCNASNMDLPDQEFLDDTEDEISFEEQHDSILGIMATIGSVTDLANLIYVELQTPVWEQEILPPDFEIDVAFIIIGIKNLGAKHGFTIKDVLVEMD
jgi:hypothetical protein